jgi:hypothetical protein
MSSNVTSIIGYASVLFTALILVELILSRRILICIVETAALASGLLLLHWTTGFPVVRVAFGGGSLALPIALMFAAVSLGMVAHYFFTLNSGFSWLTLVKPLCVSPIVLLPLIGSIEAATDLNSVQLVSLTFLAFQNGFFWKAVFTSATPKSTRRQRSVGPLGPNG